MLQVKPALKSRWSAQGALYIPATLALLMAMAGCSKESEETPEKRCTLDADCELGSFCASDGVCKSDCDAQNACGQGESCNDRGKCVVTATPCQLPSECDMPPGGAKVCDGDTSVTPASIGRCVAPAESASRECRYDDQRQPCTNGCNTDTGECNPEEPDPCDGVSCNMPPADTCKNASTLLEYRDSGTCDEGDCTYGLDEVNCPTGCENGACNPGVCQEDSCSEDDLPADRCSDQAPNLAVNYSAPVTCEEEMGAPKCVFVTTTVQCSYTGATCMAGACEDPIAQSGEVIVSEYLVVPAGEDSAKFNKQWIELYNTTDAAVELQGWTLEYATQSQSHVIAPGQDGMGSLSIPAKSHIVIANGSDPFGDGTTPDYQYSDILLGFRGTLLLKDGTGNVVDYLFWEQGSSTDGSARQIKAGSELSATSNDSPEVWCPNLTTMAGASGSFGTPGATNEPCADDPCAGFSCGAKPADYCKDLSTSVVYTVDAPMCQVSRFGSPYCDFVPQEQLCEGGTPYCLDGGCVALPDNIASMPGQIIITEVMGDPSGTDSDREWIELYNTTDAELSLFTLKLTDNEMGNSFSEVEILDPTAVIPAKGYAVLATNQDDMINGGITGAYLLGKGLLKNTPEEDMNTGLSLMKLRLVTSDDMLIDEAYYATPVSGQAQQLDLSSYTDAGIPDITVVNDTEANFCLSTTDYGMMSGKGTPGAANEECP